MITTVSSREFNQDSGAAKRAANHGPVFITDRGRPAHVLLSIRDYQKLVGDGLSLLDAIAQTGPGDAEINPPRMSGPLSRLVSVP